MPSDVKTPGLVINTLTQEQFDDLINPSDTELFLTPDTTAEDIENAVSTHNTDTTAHNDIRQAISNKSTVSVSATGTATDEVQYITVDGVEKKLAGGSGGIEYTAGEGININNTTHVITNTDHQYVPSDTTYNNILTNEKFVTDADYNNYSFYRGIYDTWEDVPTEIEDYLLDSRGLSTPKDNDYIVVKNLAGYTKTQESRMFTNGHYNSDGTYVAEDLKALTSDLSVRLLSGHSYRFNVVTFEGETIPNMTAQVVWFTKDNDNFENLGMTFPGSSDIINCTKDRNVKLTIRSSQDLQTYMISYISYEDITEGLDDNTGSWRFKYFGNWNVLNKTGWNKDFKLNTSGSGSATSLEDLTDVNIDTPTDKQALVYDAENDEWVNADVEATHMDSANVEYNNGTITSVKQALDKLLYVTPSVSIRGGGTYEIGTEITSVTLEWDWNKEIISQSLNQGIGSLDPILRIYTYSSLLTTDTTFTITGSDGEKSASSSTSVKFLPRRYWGVSEKTTLTDAEIITLGNSELSTSRTQSRTFNCSGGKYFYFVIRTDYCNNIAFKVGGLSFSDMHVETRQVVNAQGYSASYNIYRPNSLQSGNAIPVDVL